MMPHDRRLNLRKTPKHLGYLSLPPDNGGVVLDVSEGGLGFQAIAPIRAKGPIQFRFAIDSATRIKAVGEVAWIDDTGKGGGLRFTQLPEGVREKIRDWVCQPKDALLDLEVVQPPVKRATPTEILPPVKKPALAEILERIQAKPALALPPAPPEAVETQAPVVSETAPAPAEVKAEPAPATKERNPLLDNLKPPIYSGRSNKFSMFPAAPDSRADAPVFAVPQSHAIEHPMAAITLTILLAFLVSVPIFMFVTSGRAGDALFGWSRRLRGVSDSQTLPQDPAPASSPAPDLAKPPQP
jgi:hypothetical protein